MELTYNELKKRDVINIADGGCLGRINDIRLSFPNGKLLGVYVPGRRKSGILGLFERTVVYIDERKIIKIGGDVILVNLKGGEIAPGSKPKQPCPSPCPPPCPPPYPHPPHGGCIEHAEIAIFGEGEANINTDDY